MASKVKQYAVDVKTGDQWTTKPAVKATRQAKAIRAAERQFPGREVRVRLLGNVVWEGGIS